jgi:uncharacterized protein (TIGR03000 family)
MHRFLVACLILVGLQNAPVAGLVAEQTSAAKAPAQVRTRLTVTVPHEEAELLVEGKPVAGKGKSRDFQAPPLEAGKMFEYTFSVKWKPNNYTEITRVRTVRFQAGVTSVIDLVKEDPNDRAKIRYVPTPEDIVAGMIQLAGVNANDVIFEPGCGDARITIAAVRSGARRGVGIDIDPERVAESRANVKTAGLEDRIEIRLGDALDIKDLSDASVVFLYMGDEFDLLIRPHLWRQLKLGAREVSHRFTLGDWKPDKTVSMPGWDEVEYQLHLWTITKEVKDRALKESASAAR